MNFTFIPILTIALFVNSSFHTLNNSTQFTDIYYTTLANYYRDFTKEHDLLSPLELPLAQLTMRKLKNDLQSDNEHIRRIAVSFISSFFTSRGSPFAQLAKIGYEKDIYDFCLTEFRFNAFIDEPKYNNETYFSFLSKQDLEYILEMAEYDLSNTPKDDRFMLIFNVFIGIIHICKEDSPEIIYQQFKKIEAIEMHKKDAIMLYLYYQIAQEQPLGWEEFFKEQLQVETGPLSRNFLLNYKNNENLKEAQYFVKEIRKGINITIDLDSL